MNTDQLSNGIYEVLRLEIVSRGYLPDETLFIGDSDGWNTAIDAIKTSGKKPIFITNTGSFKSRRSLKENEIIISNEGRTRSQRGTKSIPKYVEKTGDPDRLEKSTTAKSLYSLDFHVTLICYDSESKTIIEDIISSVLEEYVDINALDYNGDTVGCFLLEFRRYLTLDQSNWMERAFTYEAPHVDITGDKYVGEVSKVKEITIGVTTDYEDADNADDDIETTQTF